MRPARREAFAVWAAAGRRRQVPRRGCLDRASCYPLNSMHPGLQFGVRLHPVRALGQEPDCCSLSAQSPVAWLVLPWPRSTGRPPCNLRLVWLQADPSRVDVTTVEKGDLGGEGEGLRKSDVIAGDPQGARLNAVKAASVRRLEASFSPRGRSSPAVAAGMRRDGCVSAAR